MADWNQPTITSNYLAFVTEMNAKFNESARMLFDSPPTLPTGTIRFNRSGFIFEEWDSTLQTWTPRVIGIAGGGTGSSNPAGIRVNLGLGSMATQNANAVAITGGTITGVTYSASDINTGVMALARGGTGSSLSLGPQGMVLGSFSGVVQFSSGVNIAELSASALTVGSVPKARLPATVVFTDQNNTIGGTTQLSDTIITSYGPGINNFAIRSVYPLMNFIETENVSGTKNMRMIYSGGALIWQAAAPDWSSSANILIIQHNGEIIGYGGRLTNLNATNIAAGRVGQQFLGGGAYDTSTFLRGDGNWAIPTGSGGGGAPIPFPSGMISMFATGCPAGWTRVAQFDGRFPTGSTVYGQQGGNARHSHSFSVNTSTDGNHSHSFSAGVSGRAVGSASGNTGEEDNGNMNSDSGNSGIMARASHRHFLNININVPIESGSTSGETSQTGNHYHQVSGSVGEVDIYPPYTTVIFCQKD